VTYLDSAATTLQKPVTVSRAVQHAVNHMASPGRGSHRPAMLAAETTFSCREAAVKLFHVPEPEQVVFTFNATHGLNIAIKSLVKQGDTVLISGFEHNAVTRPLTAIENVTLKVATSPLFKPELLLKDFEEKLTPEVTAVITTHVSNVFGYVIPVPEIAALCRKRNVPLIVDASQSAGCLPVDLEGWGAAFIAMPGHKGLYGPQGTGLLLCGGGYTESLIQGGTGSASALQRMPEFLPDRLEAGTHNIPGIAGLLEGIKFIHNKTPEAIFQHERMLSSRVAAGLAQLSEVEVFASKGFPAQAGVISFRLSAFDCEEVGELLSTRDVAVRSGLHCAPLAHNTAGTLETGTVRASFSAFNTIQDGERLITELERITKHCKKRNGP
jgi:cysteine desulfurase family protein